MFKLNKAGSEAKLILAFRVPLNGMSVQGPWNLRRDLDWANERYRFFASGSPSLEKTVNTSRSTPLRSPRTIWELSTGKLHAL